MKALGDPLSAHCISPERNTCSCTLVFHPSSSPLPTNDFQIEDDGKKEGAYHIIFIS